MKTAIRSATGILLTVAEGLLGLSCGAWLILHLGPSWGARIVAAAFAVAVFLWAALPWNRGDA